MNPTRIGGIFAETVCLTDNINFYGNMNFDLESIPFTATCKYKIHLSGSLIQPGLQSIF